MNDLVYAFSGTLSGEAKAFEIFIPDDGGEIRCDKNAHLFRAGDVIALPPNSVYECTPVKGICAGLERVISPVKTIEIFPDVNGCIRLCAEQALYFSEKKFPAVLSALGGLIVNTMNCSLHPSGFSPVVAKLYSEIINGVPDCMFSLEDCISKLPLNYDYVRKTFKAEVGETPQRFLLSERMKLAKNLILSGISNKYSPYSVSQIAEACGYSEPLYFSRVFKKYYGVSPSEFK